MRARCRCEGVRGARSVSRIPQCCRLAAPRTAGARFFVFEGCPFALVCTWGRGDYVSVGLDSGRPNFGREASYGSSKKLATLHLFQWCNSCLVDPSRKRPTLTNRQLSPFRSAILNGPSKLAPSGVVFPRWTYSWLAWCIFSGILTVVVAWCEV